MTGFIDIHCHILPGVDDGAKSMEQTLRLLKEEYSQGVRGVVFTPHFRIGMFETSAGKVEETFLRVKEEAKKIADDLTLYLGCEFHSTSDMVDMVKKDPRRRMADTKYVLVEFSYASPDTEIRRQVNELLRWGYRPIIAHAERCASLTDKPGRVEELCQMGAYIQVNAESILGEIGRGVKAFCVKLIRNDLVHFVATDAHNETDRAPNLKKCVQYLTKKFGDDTVRELLIHNPMKMIHNEYI